MSAVIFGVGVGVGVVVASSAITIEHLMIQRKYGESNEDDKF